MPFHKLLSGLQITELHTEQPLICFLGAQYCTLTALLMNFFFFYLKSSVKNFYHTGAKCQNTGMIKFGP